MGVRDIKDGYGDKCSTAKKDWPMKRIARCSWSLSTGGVQITRSLDDMTKAMKTYGIDFRLRGSVYE